MDTAGTSLAAAQIAFYLACKAVEAFGTALRYFDDAEDLTLAITLERFRLQTWGTNSGLANGTLVAPLDIWAEALERELNAVARLFADADKLRERYGMPAPAGNTAGVGTVSTIINGMRRSLRSSGVELPALESESASDAKDHPEATVAGPSRDFSKRVRWVVRDKERLTELVEALRGKIDRLDKLLSETQRRRVLDDYERIMIAVVSSALDERSLGLVRAVVDGLKDTDTLARVDRKRFASDADDVVLVAALPNSSPLPKLTDYNCPADFGEQSRFFARGTASGSSLVMFEKKSYDPNLDTKSKNLLEARIKTLLGLMAPRGSGSFRVPAPVGYIKDVDRHCWWLLFQFPDGDGATSPNPITQSDKPASLAFLLEPKLKLRPPLEQRLALASDLCTTFHQLFSSGCMHKSINSGNILFPIASSAAATAGMKLVSPLVCGFEYTRLETEAQTIDRSATGSPPEIAMYRHPKYQGEAAEGYKVQYDFYSLGLILLEIGRWAPLKALFEVKASRSAPPPAPVWVEGQTFHSAEAQALKRLALSAIVKELPFRVGSVYTTVAKWCLEYHDQLQSNADDDVPDHSQAFFGNVVQPLSVLASAHVKTGDEAL